MLQTELTQQEALQDKGFLTTMQNIAGLNFHWLDREARWNERFKVPQLANVTF